MAKSDLQQIQQKINTHKTNLAQNLENKQVEASADETLESLIGKINAIPAGSAGNPPVAKCVDFRTIPGKMSVELYWSEIGDLKDSTGETYAAWAGTRVVRKEGAAPVNESDGVIVTESTVMNQYAEEPYIDSGLEGKEYYYGLFPYTTDGVFAEGVFSRAIPIPYTIMTVVIDQTDENTMKELFYEDDAVDMPSGKEAVEWDEFFGHRPCLFKDGEVVGYLNPDNFYQYEDGSDADITNPDIGDVMIEFPRHGLHIETVDDKIYVKMTDSPDAEGFEYYAHDRGMQKKDAFYVSAFFAFVENNTMRSYVKSGLLSNASTAKLSPSKVHEYLENNGDGYSTFGFYQWTYLQAMYLLKYKGLNSQNLVGRGYGTKTASATAYPGLGTATTDGMDFGYPTYDNRPVKLFGIEYLWGGTQVFVDGIRIKNDTLFLAVTNDVSNFNNDDAYAYKMSVGGFSTSTGFSQIRRTIGDSEYGFLPKETVSAGSATWDRYYCDYGYVPSFSYTSNNTYEYFYYISYCGGDSRGIQNTTSGGTPEYVKYDNGIFYQGWEICHKKLNNSVKLDGTKNHFLMYI